jgi:hypothetical protein
MSGLTFSFFESSSILHYARQAIPKGTLDEEERKWLVVT